MMKQSADAPEIFKQANRLADAGKYADAIDLYDKILALDARDAAAWYHKGDALAYASRFIEAKACFENAFELGIPQARAMIAKCEEILMNEFYG